MWFFKITVVVPFESVEVCRKDQFLPQYFSLSSSMIFLLFYFYPSAGFFMLMIWRFGPLPRFLLRWRPHKELCFDWIAGLSTGAFLSIRANVRPISSEWITTKLTSIPISSCSTPVSVSIPLRLFLGSPSTALFPFLDMYLRQRPSSFLISRPYVLFLLPHGAHLRCRSFFYVKLFFGIFSLMLHPDSFLI